jgi:hypothetical protein
MHPQHGLSRDRLHGQSRNRHGVDQKFPTPGSAELYAGSAQDRFQIADVVMSYSPAVPGPVATRAYNEAVKRAIE